MPYSQGFRYCLTMVDRFSRWPEVIPLRNIEASTVARAIYENWVVRFGAPLRLTTDRGKQFEANLFKELNTLLGSTHLRTTAYHPQANGMIERVHRQLKAAIKCHQTDNWVDILPTVMLGLRAAWKEDLKATAAELVYGEPMRLPGQFLAETTNPKYTPDTLVSDLSKHFQKLRPTSPAKRGNKNTFIFQELKNAEYVFIRRGPQTDILQSPYEGPYQVIKRESKKFVVQV